MNRLDMKMHARESMRGVKPSPLLVTLVYLLISSCVTLTINTDELYMAIYTGTLRITSSRALLLGVALLIVALFIAVVQFGYTKYSMHLCRGLKGGIGTLFDGIPIAGRVIGLYIVKNIFIFLWTCLFIIPGIIKTYAYAQAERILADNPDVGILGALRQSQEMMRGEKLELFILELSFLGWMLVSVFTLGILFIWLTPYMEVTRSRFYDSLIGYRPAPAPEQGGAQPPEDSGPSVDDYWKQ